MSKPREEQPKPKPARQPVETERRAIPYHQLVVRPEDYSFREEEEFSEAALKSLAEEIVATRGITNELSVRDLGDGTCLVLDGHRRYVALGILIERRVEGFSREMLVPANVVTTRDATERELLARAIGLNFHRSPIGAMGRIKAAVGLTRHGMPKAEVARILEIGTSTLDRDLLLGTTEWIMDHLRNHDITPTGAASLLEGARKAKRVDEFRAEFERWVGDTKERLREENQRRQARDEDLLAGPDLWAQKYLTRDQLEDWADALRTERPFGKAVFKFKALIRREKGTVRIEIDGLSKDVSELSTEDLGKIYERLVDMGEELIPVLERRLNEERRPAEGPAPKVAGRARLRALGLAELADRLDSIEKARAESAGQADPDFDRAPERDEKDLSGTAGLPPPPDAAEDPA
jgi:ParB-like chromosome segregation protein Spo0J